MSARRSCFAIGAALLLGACDMIPWGGSEPGTEANAEPAREGASTGPADAQPDSPLRFEPTPGPSGAPPPNAQGPSGAAQMPTLSLPPPTAGAFYLGAEATTILPLLKTKAGAKLIAREIVIYPAYAVAELSDASDPTLVSRYLVRDGAAGDPSPVKLLSIQQKKLSQELFDPDPIDWAAVPRMAKDAAAKVNAPITNVSHCVIHRPIPFGTDVRLRFFVKRPDGKSAFLDYDVKGVLQKVHDR